MDQLVNGDLHLAAQLHLHLNSQFGETLSFKAEHHFQPGETIRLRIMASDLKVLILCFTRRAKIIAAADSWMMSSNQPDVFN